jgi:hypothetical protein
MNRGGRHGAARVQVLALGLALSGVIMAGNVAHADPGATATPPAKYSAADLYNVANAYARAGKPGMAVLNYERARLLAPEDPDIEANLRFVRQAAKLPAPPPTWAERTVMWVGPTTVSWLGVGGIVLAGACLLLGGRARRHPAYRWLNGGGLATGIVLVGVTVCNAVVVWPRLHEAVVLTAATPVRVSPVPMSEPLFTLPEAETVRITAEHDEFLLVETRTGKTGWVARANLAPVVPRP